LEDRLPSALGEVDRAVIMVSPFPELKPIAPQGLPASNILGIFSALLPTLIDQARFKPSEIILAADRKHGSRYLIGPSRVIDDGTKNGKEQVYGIASGLLGGFGGFAARTFRDHDYQLGRRNCQQFLRQAFALPAGNPIVVNWKEAGVDITKFHAIPRENDPETYYCIIPLFGTAKAEVALPDWPLLLQARFDTLQTHIAKRFDDVTPKLVAQNVKGFLGFLLRLPLKPLIRNIPGLIRDKALTFVRFTILADLVRRDQIEGWELPGVWHLPIDLGNGTALDGDDIRLVLGELLNPAHDGCYTVESLAKATALGLLQVEKALDLCRGPEAEGMRFKVWKAPWTEKTSVSNKDSGPLYTLASRKPPLFERIGGFLYAKVRNAT
jgi:hypothetical protein